MKEVTLPDSVTALQSLKASLFRFEVIDFASSQLTQAASLLEHFGAEHDLRTLDSLQLASFLSKAQPDWRFVTSDTKLVNIVGVLGYQVINPNSPNPNYPTI